MRVLSTLEKKIYNSGERLIPKITHDFSELVRHMSSYLFFRRMIDLDIATQEKSGAVHIIDLGCGVGYGCEILSKIPNSQIMGIDCSPESIEYAKSHYIRKNITYLVVDLVEYIPKMPEFDYIVSRNTFEHIPNGLQLALNTKWRFRLMFDVPYDEPPGHNPHHLLFNIREEAFSKFPEKQLFYQDLAGFIYNIAHKPPTPNIIICVCKRPSLQKIADSNISFPVPPWQPRFANFYKAYNQIWMLLWRVMHRMKMILRASTSKK